MRLKNQIPGGAYRVPTGPTDRAQIGRVSTGGVGIGGIQTLPEENVALKASDKRCFMSNGLVAHRMLYQGDDPRQSSYVFTRGEKDTCKLYTSNLTQCVAMAIIVRDPKQVLSRRLVHFGGGIIRLSLEESIRQSTIEKEKRHYGVARWFCEDYLTVKHSGEVSIKVSVIAKEDTYNHLHNKLFQSDCEEGFKLIKTYNQLTPGVDISLDICYTKTGHVAVKEDGKIVAIPEPKAMPSPHLTSARPCFWPWC